MARSRLPFSVSGIRKRQQAAGLFAGEPVPCPRSFGPGAGDLGDAGGELGRKQTVVGRLGGQLSNGGELDIDGGSGKAARLELGPVALDGRFGEAVGAGRHAPGEKLGQHAIVGAAGMGRANAVEHQALDRRERLGQLRPDGHVVLCQQSNTAHRGGTPIKLQLHGSAGMLLVPERDQRRLDPMAHGAKPVDAGVAGGAKGNQKAGADGCRDGGGERRVSAQTHRRGSGGRRDRERPRGGRQSGGGSGPAANSRSRHNPEQKSWKPRRRGRKAGPADPAQEACGKVAQAGPAKVVYRQNLL